MEFKDIDSMFDDAARRLKSGVNPTAAYGEPPLAADHYLLRRSWEFFQKRIQSMEDHWSQIAAAKDAEIEALLKAGKEGRSYMADLKDRANETDEIDRTLVSGRLEEQQAFAAQIRSLRETWEGEREALERRVTDAEGLKDRIRREAESRLAAMEADLRGLRESLAGAMAEISALTDKRAQGEGVAAETMLKRDEVIRSLESKVELLKSELARRELLQRESADRFQELNRDHQRLLADQREGKAALGEMSNRVVDIEERLAHARRELEEIRTARQREQSEWRELWERAREMWELEKRNARNADSPSENA